MVLLRINFNTRVPSKLLSPPLCTPAPPRSASQKLPPAHRSLPGQGGMLRFPPPPAAGRVGALAPRPGFGLSSLVLSLEASVLPRAGRTWAGGSAAGAGSARVGWMRKTFSLRKLFLFCTKKQKEQKKRKTNQKETVSRSILTTRCYFVIESNRVFFYRTERVAAVPRSSR